VSYFGEVYEVEELSDTFRLRFTGFNQLSSDELSTLETNIKTKVCEMTAEMSECSQWSVECQQAVGGSDVVAILTLVAISDSMETLSNIRADLRNKVASYSSERRALSELSGDVNDPFATLDRYFWNNKRYSTIFTKCPLSREFELAEGETERIITWSLPEAEWSDGEVTYEITPTKSDLVEINRGEEKPVGSYYVLYHAEHDGDQAYPCSFYVRVVSPYATEEEEEEGIFTTEMMVVVAGACACVGVLICCCCWCKFGRSSHDHKFGDDDSSESSALNPVGVVTQPPPPPKTQPPTKGEEKAKPAPKITNKTTAPTKKKKNRKQITRTLDLESDCS